MLVSRSLRRMLLLSSMLYLSVLCAAVLGQDNDTGLITLSVNNADVVELLKSISSQSEYDIAISSDVKGTVTLSLDSADVIEAVSLISELAGAAYTVEGTTIKVLSKREYLEQYGLPPFDKRRLEIFDLQHGSAATLIGELNKLKSSSGILLIDSRANRIYAFDTPQMLANMRFVTNQADVARGFRVYELETITPGELHSAITNILTPSASVTGDVSRNRLIVIDLPERLAILDSLVASLDKPGHMETRIYALQYADAEEISQQLQTLLTPNLGALQVLGATNQFLITDLPQKLDLISQTLSLIDRRDRQVYIEARIIQVSLTDNLKLGINWEALTNKIEELGPVGVSADYNILSSSDQGLRFSSGLLSEKNYEFVLEALAEVGKADLLSAPHITATNNNESRILVGSSIPYKTVDTREENGAIRTFEKVTMVDVGIKLYVTPTINDSNFIRLKIRPEVSSVTSFSDGIPVVEKTEAETEVLIKDGVTLIIGGLIKEELRETVKKIPLLGSIPILGKLFSSTDREKVKSELLIFITPHLITGEVTQSRGN